MDEKRRKWEAIKSADPGLAEWLEAFNKSFGKPAAMRVELSSGEVI